MAGRVPFRLVAAAAALAALASNAANGDDTPPPPSVTPLVSYSFDDGRIDAGPDTFSVFQFGRGAVRLNAENRFSGYHSVELRDAPGDGTFPELQGYFPRQTRGKLYLHFALMSADPREDLNIALAGPQWFQLKKHGIGFWLKTAGGYLTAISDSMPKKLFEMRAFAWYVCDAVYDVDAGTFDLIVREEGTGREPVAVLRGAANAPNQPGSAVDKFSFIGDHKTDESKVVYYVDDILVSAAAPGAATRGPLVAPGRRKLFIDYWNESRRSEARRPAPLPMTKLEDLGIGGAEMDELRRGQAVELLGAVVSGRFASLPEEVTGRGREILAGVLAWRQGDTALRQGEAAAALKHYGRALEALPGALLAQVNAAMALAHLGRWDEAEQRLGGAAGWRGDARLGVALARLGLARGDGSAGSDDSRLGAEMRFMAMLWRGEMRLAEEFAEAMIARAEEGRARALWRERLGDAAFLGGDAARARVLYEEALQTGPEWPAAVWTKLSDACFQLGDLAGERSYRERVYGSLAARQ